MTAPTNDAPVTVEQALRLAVATLQTYADPSGYTDANGEPYDSDSTVHSGVLAQQTLDRLAALASAPAVGMDPQERVLNVTAAFGPTLKSAFPKVSALERMAVAEALAEIVEVRADGVEDRYSEGYSQGTIDANQQHQWMQDKAWQDAVLMLVHYNALAERTWLIGHEEAARKLAEWWGHARALADTKTTDDIAALARPRAAVGERAFQMGDRVEKISGSSWRGKVVGTYSTALTPEGYAVESETETGSVQIYPVKALRLALQSPPAKVER